MHIVKGRGWRGQCLANGEVLGKWMVKSVVQMKVIWLEFGLEKLDAVFGKSGCYFCS